VTSLECATEPKYDFASQILSVGFTNALDDLRAVVKIDQTRAFLNDQFAIASPRKADAPFSYLSS
jgi:hypothetical protein